MQQPTDQSIGLRKDVPRQYLDIALVAGQYKIYCPAMAFDPPTQSVTYIYIYIYIYTHTINCKTNFLYRKHTYKHLFITLFTDRIINTYRYIIITAKKEQHVTCIVHL